MLLSRKFEEFLWKLQNSRQHRFYGNCASLQFLGDLIRFQSIRNDNRSDKKSLLPKQEGCSQANWTRANVPLMAIITSVGNTRFRCSKRSQGESERFRSVCNTWHYPRMEITGSLMVDVNSSSSKDGFTLVEFSRPLSYHQWNENGN